MTIHIRARHQLASITLALVLGLAPLSVAAQGAGFRQAVAEVVADSDAAAIFYRERAYAPLWTAPDATTLRQAFFTALSQVEDHGLPSARYDAEGLVSAFRAARSDRDLGLLEARMTRTFLTYARDISSGVLEPSRVVSDIVREVKRPEPAALLHGISGADPAAFLRGLPPRTPEYARLMKEKHLLEQRIAGTGWGATVPNATLRPGDSGPAVIALRDRLMAMGFLGRSAVASYDEALQNAVQSFQRAHGLQDDGVAGPATIAELNVSPEARLRAVIVTLERERWMDRDRGARHIWVNLADFTTQIIDDGKVSFETRSVIGKNDAVQQTPEFSDMMTYMAINPSWTIPRSIIGRDYLPQLQRNPNAVGHLQVVDSRGQVINRNAIDFTQYTIRTFPFGMRQAPGPQNALGTVKFMFPNRYAIYLHDTPQKNLFGADLRMFSNGCIRLQDPHDFAFALLSRQESDPQSFFSNILRTGRETNVTLAQPVPIHLVYRTAIANARGEVNYRRDIYGRDARIFDALMQAGVVLTGVRG